MKNTLKIGDVVTMNAEPLAAYSTRSYRDCTAGKEYTVTGVGELAYANEPTAVTFLDDVGDTVITRFEHVTKV